MQRFHTSFATEHCLGLQFLQGLKHLNPCIIYVTHVTVARNNLSHELVSCTCTCICGIFKAVPSYWAYRYSKSWEEWTLINNVKNSHCNHTCINNCILQKELIYLQQCYWCSLAWPKTCDPNLTLDIIVTWAD